MNSSPLETIVIILAISPHPPHIAGQRGDNNKKMNRDEPSFLDSSIIKDRFMGVASLLHNDGDCHLFVVASNKAIKSTYNMSGNKSASSSTTPSSSSHHVVAVGPNSICQGIYSPPMLPPLHGVVSVGRSLVSGRWDDEEEKALMLPFKKTSSVVDCCCTTHTSSTAENETTEVDDLTSLPGWSEQEIVDVAEYWNLSDEYKKGLYDLGYRLRDINHDKNCAEDVAFFLMNTFGKVDKAETMFRECIRWRQKVGADTIVQNPPPQEVIDNIPCAILKGLDREGDPIFLDRFLSCDIMSLLNKYGVDTLVHHAVWIREAVSQGSWREDWENRRGKTFRQITVICDVEGLSRKLLMHRKGIHVHGEILRLDQNYYPGSFKRYVFFACREMRLLSDDS